MFVEFEFILYFLNIQPDRKLNYRFCLPPSPKNCNVGEKVSVHENNKTLATASTLHWGKGDGPQKAVVKFSV